MSSRTPRLAVLVPTYNGGSRLAETVRSCANARFSPDQLMVVVADNRSEDDSVAALSGSPAARYLHVYHNPCNLGRVANWNRAMGYAADLGADFFTFLMVGDELLPGEALLHITEEMTHRGADLTLAPYRIRFRSSQERSARNFLHGRRELRDGRALVQSAIRSGTFIFGPLQANVYRMDRSRPLRFDPDDPVQTDQKATIEWASARGRKVLLWDEPYSVWQEHPGRFHMQIDLAGLIRADLDCLRNLAAQYGVEVDWPRVHATMFLLRVRDTHSGIGLWQRTRTALAVLREAAPGLHAATILRVLYDKLARGQSALQLPRAAG